MLEPSRLARHHAHALAVAPIELSGLLFDLELFGRECVAWWKRSWSGFRRPDRNEGSSRRSPWDFPCWSSRDVPLRCRRRGRRAASAFLDDCLQVRAVSIAIVSTRPPGEIEDENAAGSAVRGFACLYRKRRFLLMRRLSKMYRYGSVLLAFARSARSESSASFSVCASSSTECAPASLRTPSRSSA